MSFTEKFISERSKIEAALSASGIKQILRDKNKIPSVFPAAIVTIKEEEGKDPADIEYLQTNLNFEIYLVTDAFNDADPDLTIYQLKEAFRNNYLSSLFNDFRKIQYYDSKVNGTRPVKIAMMETGI